MTYAEYCAEKCEWCAKGKKRIVEGDKATHQWVDNIGHYGDLLFAPCTAPTRDQFEQELLERKNAELRKLMQEIACRCSWELQGRPGQHVSHIPGRRELQDALRSIRQQIESFDAAMQSAGEPRAKCPGCQASYAAKWAGTTCSNCDEIIAKEQKNG